MTGADMNMFVPPVRRKLAMNLTQPAQMMASATGQPTMARSSGQADATANEWTDLGGPDGGRGQDGNSHPTDLRSFDSLGDFFNDPNVQKDGRALLDMITGMSPSLVAGNMISGGFQGMGPQMPSFRPNDAVADEIAQAAGGGGATGGGVSAADLGAEASSPGMFNRGGVVTQQDVMAMPIRHRDQANWDSGDSVMPGDADEILRWNNNDAAGFTEGGKITNDRMTGPDPEGPDTGYVAVRENEVVLTPEQLAALPLDARAKIARMLLGK